MLAKAWRPASDRCATPNSEYDTSPVLRELIAEMHKFKTYLKEQEPEDDSWKKLRPLISLAEDLDNLGSLTPPDKQFERVRLLRDYKLWLPLNDLLSGKNLSSTLMINGYLYALALYAQRHTSQAYMIDSMVDLEELLLDTLRHVNPGDSYVEPLNNLRGLAASM